MNYRVRDLIRAFDRHTLDTARTLLDRREVDLMPAGPEATRLFGMVRPSKGKGKRVWASATPASSGAWEGECTCAQNSGCPHVAAVLLAGLGPEADAALEREEQRRRSPPTTPPTPKVVRESRRRPYTPTTENRAFETWLQRIDALHQTDDAATAEVAPPRRRLLYLLGLRGAGGRPGPLTVWPVVVNIKKNGSYGTQRSCGFAGGVGGPDYITSKDRELLPAVLGSSSRHWGYSFTSPISLVPEAAPRLLERLIATGRCHWENKASSPLHLDESRRGTVTWTIADDGAQSARVVLDGSTEETVVLATRPTWYVDTTLGACGPVETDLPGGLLEALLEAPRLEPGDVEQARRSLKNAAGKRSLPLPKALAAGIEDVRTKPVPSVRLQLFQEDDGEYYESPEPGLTLAFRYGDFEVRHDDPREVVQRAVDDRLVRVHRDSNFENETVAKLESLGWLGIDFAPDAEPATVFIADDLESVDTFLIDFTREGVPALRSAGWIVEIADDWPYRFVEASDWYVEVHEAEASDWFELELGIEVDGERLSLLPVLVNLLRDPRCKALLEDIEQADSDLDLRLPIGDGRVITFPAVRLQAILGTLIELYHAEAGTDRLALSAWGAPRLAELEDAFGEGAVQWTGGERLRELGRTLRTFRGLEPVEPPDGFHGELRDYQRRGLDWLQFLRTHGLSGILADDMGLGKTVQFLAHLLVERREGRADLPSLIVAPTSLMANWRQEAARFAPELRVVTLHGPNRSGRFDELAECDLALTTYPLLHRDAEKLRRQPFHLIAFDEAQFIKNASTKAARAARTLEAHQRICLTGTPMENHLGELWSLFHLLEPGLLGDKRRFGRTFRTPIEKHGDEARRAALVARVRPFLLRRTKEEVAADLPPKTEITRVVELHAGQRDLYESIRSAMHERVRKEIERNGLAKSSIVILDALLRLRQVCCDPRLVKLKEARRVKASAKLEALLEMLDELVGEGRRILLFSQFTSMLTRIEPELGKRDIAWVKLTGNTRDRETPVRRFQNGEVPLFLISLKAGGTGLNLTAADTVIHYDPWWNPAVESQATDRAHRIGQDKPVFVYKLIVAGSVEEKMVALGARKRALAEGIYGAGTRTGLALNAEDLEVLFRPLE